MSASSLAHWGQHRDCAECETVHCYDCTVGHHGGCEGDPCQCGCEQHDGQHAECMDCGTAVCADCVEQKHRSCFGEPCACSCQQAEVGP